MDEEEKGPQFSLAYSDEMSTDEYAMFLVLLKPFDEDAITQTVLILPCDRMTLDLYVVDNWSRLLLTGRQAIAHYTDENVRVIDPESIRDIVVPNIFLLLSMAITGYNFMNPEAQRIAEMEDQLDVSEDELPKGDKFDFETPEDLFKQIDE